MDRDHFIEEARETMLTIGHLMPILHVQFAQEYLMIALDIFSDQQSVPTQYGMMVRQGWETCKRYPGQMPEALAMSAVYWISRADPLRPVRDMRKCEAIIVSFWHADGDTKETAHLPIRRDPDGRVVEVGPLSPWKTQLAAPLEAFLHGCRDAQLPDEEVETRMIQQMKRNLGTLTPQKREELMRLLEEEGLSQFIQDL